MGTTTVGFESLATRNWRALGDERRCSRMWQAISRWMCERKWVRGLPFLSKSHRKC